MNIRVREFTNEDFWQVENLVRQFMNNDPYSPPIIVRQEQDLFGDFFLVASDLDNLEDGILGYVMGGIEYRNKIVGWILEIYVKEESRGQGIGNELLYSLIPKLKNAGVSEIRLTVDPQNDSALKIYQKNGFQKADCIFEHYRRDKKVYLMKNLE